MQAITELQYDDLVHRIYESLISADDMGLGEMGTCNDEAERIATEWCKENNIKLQPNN